MSVNSLCTYLDRNYLARGLALYGSLQRHAGPFRLFVLCFDNDSFRTLNQMRSESLIPISIDEFESGDEALIKARDNRSRIEYYFTCSPSLPLFLLQRYPDIDILTYVDADLFFFSSLEPIYDALKGRSILIIEHRFPLRLRHLARRGIYNVGLLSFRNDAFSLDCLRWWRERCLEWCHDRVEAGRYADQRYLDDWPSRFQGVVVLRHRGAGLAPWNVSRYRIHRQNDVAMVDSVSLVFFHFHGFRPIAPFLYESGLGKYGMRMTPQLRKLVFAPYLRNLLPLMRKHGNGKDNTRFSYSPYDPAMLLRRLIDEDTLFVLRGLVLNIHLRPRV